MPFRDIDIAIYARGGDPLELKFELDGELSGRLGLPVDVKVLNDAPPWFIASAIEEGVVLVDKVPGLLERLYLLSLDRPGQKSPRLEAGSSPAT